MTEPRAGCATEGSGPTAASAEERHFAKQNGWEVDQRLLSWSDKAIKSLSNIPPTLTELLQSEDPPQGFLNWFTEAEVRAALQAGKVGDHEGVVRAWLHTKERERLDLERAAASASRAQRWNEVVMWTAIIAGVLALTALLIRSLS